ncbi:MAG: hypothetical protein JNL75_09895 [Chitinophagales bacterium]|nr:hypothetical protein [Chitinophagales bacterium]
MKYSLLFIVVLWVLGCSKSADSEAPKIEFIKPKGMDTFSVGIDSLHLNFKLTDDDNLTQYSYVIKDTFDVKYVTNGKFIDGKTHVHSSYVVFGGFGGLQKLWLYITAYDRAYNKTVEVREFYVQP